MRYCIFSNFLHSMMPYDLEQRPVTFVHKINRPCLSLRKIREKRREDALLATSNYRTLVTEVTGNETITNNHTVHDIYIVKQQV